MVSEGKVWKSQTMYTNRRVFLHKQWLLRFVGPLLLGDSFRDYRHFHGSSHCKCWQAFGDAQVRVLVVVNCDNRLSGSDKVPQNWGRGVGNRANVHNPAINLERLRSADCVCTNAKRRNWSLTTAPSLNRRESCTRMRQSRRRVPLWTKKIASDVSSENEWIAERAESRDDDLGLRSTWGAFH